VLLKQTHSPIRWQKVQFIIEKKDKILYLNFGDMRMFGKINYIDKEALESLKTKYGPEPIDNTLTKELFHKQIKSKNTSIKNILLDQKIISGLGNIYATDALWMAKVHPETRTKDITPFMSKNIFKAAKEVLLEGINNRGSTLEDKMYVDLLGKPGNQQNNFKIYGKQQCQRCNIPNQFKKISGRGTYFCEQCQLKDGQQKLL
jgi:formamidopyrimidine-DNA glycosylase